MNHTYGEIGTRDEEGRRTFGAPGDVCMGCSVPERGLWVPVSFCAAALDDYYRHTPWADREWDERVDRVWRGMRAYRMAP